MLLALAAPPGDHPDHPALRLLTTLLAGGRTSRLHCSLVDEGQLCSWVSADLSEGLDASQTTISAEVVPDVEPAQVEAELFRLLADFFRNPPDEEEVERAKQITTADWVFGHERVHTQAISLGLAVTLFDAGEPADHLYFVRAGRLGAFRREEGHEPQFLAGAWGMFERRRTLLMMEVNPTAWSGEAQVREWQDTVDRLFALYGDGLWFDAATPRKVSSLDVATLDDTRAFSLLFPGRTR